MSAAAFTLATLACGWVALWPLRSRLGVVGYHLSAYPIGLLGWVAVAGVGTLAPGGWGPTDALAGLALAALGAAAIGWGVAARSASGGSGPSAWTFAAWGVALAGLAWGMHEWGITAGTYDSVFHYQAWGVWFSDGLGLKPAIVGAFGPLVPAVCAGGRLFGIEWMSTPWPLLALHAAVLVGWEVVSGRPRLARRPEIAVAVITIALFVTTAQFVGNSIYLHSHMLSAVFLMLALVGVERGLGQRSGTPTHGDATWCWVAGLSAAGLALARVDGLAYAVVPLTVAGVIRLRRRMPGRVLAPLVAGFAVPVAVYAVAAFGTLGMWDSDKLPGIGMAAVLAVLALVAGLLLAGERIPWMGPRLAARPERWVAGAALLAMLLVAAVRWENVSSALGHMASNLFVTGGFGTLWYVIIAMIVLSVLTRSLWVDDEWPGHLLLAIGLFAAVAVIVHGTGHPGRIGPGDSFSRVAFHIVPIAFWYGGLFAKGLVTGIEGARPSDESTGAR